MSTDAIGMLKSEHERLRALFGELVATSPQAVKRRRRLLEALSKELDAHTTLEEEIFYPAVKAVLELNEDEALPLVSPEEHRLAKLVLSEIGKVDGNGPEFTAKLSVLKELLEHHLDQEEKVLFPKAAKLLEPAQLEQLYRRMQKRRRVLEQRFTNGSGRSAQPPRMS